MPVISSWHEKEQHYAWHRCIVFHIPSMNLEIQGLLKQHHSRPQRSCYRGGINKLYTKHP